MLGLTLAGRTASRRLASRCLRSGARLAGFSIAEDFLPLSRDQAGGDRNRSVVFIDSDIDDFRLRDRDHLSLALDLDPDLGRDRTGTNIGDFRPAGENVFDMHGLLKLSLFERDRNQSVAADIACRDGTGHIDVAQDDAAEDVPGTIGVFRKHDDADSRTASFCCFHCTFLKSSAEKPFHACGKLFEASEIMTPGVIEDGCLAQQTLLLIQD